MRTNRLAGQVRLAAITVLVAVCIPWSATSAQNGDALTLDRVIREVLKKNDRLAASKFMAQSDKNRARSAGAWDDPMLMVGVQNVPTNFDFKMDPMTMKMVGLSQNIPYAGQKGLEKKAAQADAAASDAQVRVTEVDLVVAARQAYADLFYLRLNLRELESQKDIVEQIAATATSKLKSNQAGQDEVLAAQAEVWRVESSILSQQQQIEAAEKGLNSLRGVDPSGEVPELTAPPVESVPDSVSSWLDLARRNYPALARVNLQAEGYGFSAKASRRMRWPMLGISGSYGIRSGSTTDMEGVTTPLDNMFSLQANISLPLFSRRAQSNMARSMDAMRQSSLAEANQLWRDAQADLQSLHARARRLRQSLELYRGRIVPTSQDAYQSALSGYTNNRLTFASLLNYAANVNRDKITANEIAGELERTLAEVHRYTAVPVDTTTNEK